MNAVERERHTVKANSLNGSTHSDLEKAGFDWFSQHRAQGVPVSGPMLQQMADLFALKMGLDYFNNSKGWLDHVKSRHNITQHKICGKSEAISAGSVGNWLPVLQGILMCYQPCNVYNTDERAMFLNLLPDQTFGKGGHMQGREEGQGMLHVGFVHSTPTCVAGTAESCSVDNCPAHPHIQNFPNNELIFLPSNITKSL
ncbi:hypothetical protein PR048_018664 [Dryococelus australis]|uniref:HTH CENPB-type domain-containing protein n=1 Tax=Dryococelus australis TaxID=614101 RepID=A0ABQ9HD15_9NEOP|nr:hypothetical protein PR048_018664 [Dryococelus australis]